MTRDEEETREQFEERYSRPWQDLHRTIERTVIGSDWGANGYTTLSQANQLLSELRLEPDRTLLDLGAGRGWPGLYFASRTGCRVVAVDLPVEGLALGRERAEAEGVQERFLAVVASASALPLPPQSVDAVVATDVFC